MKDTECAAVRKEFGAQLKALRKARRLTAAELGLRTDIHEKDVYRYESGAQYPSWKRWCRLYKDFGGAAFPSYRPIAAGVELLPVTDAVLDELDELTKTFSIEEIRRGCRMPIGGNLYNIMYGKCKCVHRRTLQNIFDFLGWGEISDEKMGGYTVPLSGT